MIITPNSFLRAPLAGHLGSNTADRWTIGKRWAALQIRLRELTKLLRNEVIHQLHQEDIWIQRDLEPRVGQLCIVLDDRADRMWPLARITKTYPHAVDGVVREVDVQMARHPRRPPMRRGQCIGCSQFPNSGRTNGRGRTLSRLGASDVKTKYMAWGAVIIYCLVYFVRYIL